jgi:ABC-type transport system substrate-binding protein
MRKSAGQILCVGAVVALLSGLVGMSSGAANSGGFTFGLSSEPPNLDPHLNTGTAAQTVKIQLYRGLFKYGASGRVEGDLVESYQQPTSTTYIFRLRRGLRFSDGTPLSSEDVVFSFDRIADPKVGAYLRKRLSDIEQVTAIDSRTVKVVLRTPDAAFLDVLAMPLAAVVSRRFTLAHNDDLKTSVLGEGPYKLTQWQRGVQLTVERNPYYYRPGLPKAAWIRFLFYPDESSRVAALQSGAVNIIEYVPWQAISALRSDPRLAYQGTNGPFMFLIFNVSRPPFDDVRVRRAVGYAIDRAAIVRTVFFGHGAPIYGLPIPQGNFAYDPGLAHYYTYDPARAKRLLAEAGYGSGFTATLLSTSQYGMHKDTAEIIQEDLNSLGNHISLSLPDWPTRVSLGAEGRYQFAVHGTAPDYNDPDFLSLFFHSGPLTYLNSPGYADHRVDQLLDRARSTADASERRALYLEIQRRALDESPFIFLSWREQGYAYSRKLTGFANLPGFLTFYSGYTLEETVLSP